MATNFVQAGNNLSIPAPANVSSGMPVFAGQIKGIAAGSALAGQSVDVLCHGVFALPKVAADDMALGTAIYWNATSGLATITAGGNTKLGVAVEAAGISAGTVRVRLSGF